ncbi:MAG: molybdopterin-dependent oxidoreductase [Nitrospirae bacterium]|nr:molybdopterin-dependent oxidoreductase [Nitrospirota bacterium]
MTNSWTDIENADVVLIMGCNPAENHPLAMKHVLKAKEKGATIINVDPRFCRSSSQADIYAPMRSGTDIAFIGGMIKYAIDHGLYNTKYVRECTNALLMVNSGFETCEEGTKGVFSGLTTPGTYYPHLDATLDAAYTKTTWDYDAPLTPTVAANLTDSGTVFDKLKKQFANYTIENVCAITGTPEALYQEICETFCSTYPDNKSATILYAMGTTQHTIGSQNIRAYSILQLLLGNMGVAGGGINALRGQVNVQGATDQAVLHHILPGYLKVPTPSQTTLTDYMNANYNSAHAVNPVHNYTVRGTSGVDPISVHWWKNGRKYIAALLKAWWPGVDCDTGYSYLLKKTGDHSILTMFDEMSQGHIDGAIFVGENPAVSDPDSDHVRAALANLEWLVCVDPFETETAAFWRLNTLANTTVYLLPCAVGIEKYGSFTNSSRWLQWSWSGGNPPGEARTDLDILVDLGTRLKTAFSAEPQMSNLNWPCFGYTGQTGDALAELVAKEMHGYFWNGSSWVLHNGTFLNFPDYTGPDYLYACGNWLHCGSFAVSLDAFESPNQGAIWPAGGVGNRAKRRYPIDVGNAGWTDPGKLCSSLYSYWSWCWPVNRRIVYNRASMYLSDKDLTTLAGDPLAPQKYVVKWDPAASTFRGDVIDGGGNPGPGTWPYPFIMLKDGHGHLFGGWTLSDGPFPWHYEPAESPIAYPSWLGTYRMNPTVHLYDPGNVATNFAEHGDDEYNIFATSYRITEHYHTGTMTRNIPILIELQPEPFVEISEELAADTTGTLVKNSDTNGPISNGDDVIVTSARGSITVKACVTKRFKPFRVNGTIVHQVGIIWHWGFMGLSTGDSGNILTPYIGDANTRIPESKCFRVNIEKV